jgi:hypothetical protein
MPVKDPKKDDERLSALLDGRVSGREREELLAHLMASEADYEVFTDTVDLLMAEEEEDARAAATAQEGVIPLRPRAGGPRMPRRWLIAASLAALALVSTLTLWSRGSTASDPVQLAARVDPGREGLPADWGDAAPWSTVRGPGAGARDADAVRAGVKLVDLAVAAQAGDTAEVRILAEQLRDRADPGASASSPLGQIAEQPDAPPDAMNALLKQATGRLASLGRKPLELGAWTEAARLAARSRDEAFFRDRVTDGMLRRAERLAGDNAKARAAVDDVRAALPGDGPPQWTALELALDALLRALAR